MLDFLTDPAIVAEIAQAWRDSQADDPDNRHEEGGYVVLNPDLSYAIERWTSGGQARVVPPPLLADLRYNGRAVVAAFHTHPNPATDEVGRQWEQGPSTPDRRWHARRRLTGLVVSRTTVYAIDVQGNVSTLGPHDKVLSP